MYVSSSRGSGTVRWKAGLYTVHHHRARASPTNVEKGEHHGTAVTMNPVAMTKIWTTSKLEKRRATLRFHLGEKQHRGETPDYIVELRKAEGEREAAKGWHSQKLTLKKKKNLLLRPLSAWCMTRGFRQAITYYIISKQRVFRNSIAAAMRMNHQQGNYGTTAAALLTCCLSLLLLQQHQHPSVGVATASMAAAATSMGIAAAERGSADDAEDSLSCPDGVCPNKDVDGGDGGKAASSDDGSSNQHHTYSDYAALGMRFASDLGVPQGYGEMKYRDEIDKRIREAREHVGSIRDSGDEALANACRNRDEWCSYWAAMGECESGREFMDANCAPVCGRCRQLCQGAEACAELAKRQDEEDARRKEEKIMGNVYDEHQALYQREDDDEEEELVQEEGLGSELGVIQEYGATGFRDEVHEKIDEARDYMKGLSESLDKGVYRKIKKACRNKDSLCAYWAARGAFYCLRNSGTVLLLRTCDLCSHAGCSLTTFSLPTWPQMPYR